MIRNLQLHNIEIIETGKKYGNMNTNSAFYPEGMSAEERKKIFLGRRLKLGRDYGFDGHKMFMADQKDKSGTWFELDRDYVEAHPEGWSDISQDILIVTDKTPGVVIGHPVADCPVVMAFDPGKGVIAIGHCSAELVDRKMPALVVEALQESHDSREDDIAVYVSACAGRSWTYDRYPSWATDDSIWSEAITLGEDGLYHIDLKSAVLRQLREKGIIQIYHSGVDTITDPDFYSNSAARSDESKKGRHFAGSFFR